MTETSFCFWMDHQNLSFATKFTKSCISESFEKVLFRYEEEISGRFVVLGSALPG